MSKIGEWLAWNLNRLFPPLVLHQRLEIAKSDVEANQLWAYEEAKQVCKEFAPHWDLDGKRVLNIGHGLGGKLPFYAEEGARMLVGVDINVESTRIAQKYLQSLDLDGRVGAEVALSAANAGYIPFRDNSFDAVVSINTFEHIMALEEALHACHRVLRVGGLAFLYLPPYYSPWGPHLESWIHFPWPHLLFSDETLMRVAARLDANLQLNQRFVGAAQIDWTEDAQRIPGVNRVTIRQFCSMLSQVDFSVVAFKLLPFGHHRLREGGDFGRMALFLLNKLTGVPLLREIITTKMVFVLRKRAAT